MTDYDLYYAIGKYVMDIWERNICTPEEILATLSFTNLVGDLTRDGYRANDLLHITKEEFQNRINEIDPFIKQCIYNQGDLNFNE